MSNEQKPSAFQRMANTTLACIFLLLSVVLAFLPPMASMPARIPSRSRLTRRRVAFSSSRQPQVEQRRLPRQPSIDSITSIGSETPIASCSSTPKVRFNNSSAKMRRMMSAKSAPATPFMDATAEFFAPAGKAMKKYAVKPLKSSAELVRPAVLLRTTTEWGYTKPKRAVFDLMGATDDEQDDSEEEVWLMKTTKRVTQMSRETTRLTTRMLRTTTETVLPKSVRPSLSRRTSVASVQEGEEESEGRWMPPKEWRLAP